MPSAAARADPPTEARSMGTDRTGRPRSVRARGPCGRRTTPRPSPDGPRCAHVHRRRAGGGGELAGQMADTAGCLIDQHLAAQQQSTLPQRMQGREPRHGQRRPLRIRHLVRQRGDRVGRHTDSSAHAPDGSMPTTRCCWRDRCRPAPSLRRHRQSPNPVANRARLRAPHG